MEYLHAVGNNVHVYIQSIHTRNGQYIYISRRLNIRYFYSILFYYDL